ncbi:MAG: hypothetical protein ACK45E_05620, partial [Ignavibacteria bacterium]
EEHLVRELLFGEWSNITRIIVTHRLRHLAEFDVVVIVESGKIVASGTYNEVQHNPYMLRLLEAQSEADHSSAIERSTGSSTSTALHGFIDEPQQEVGRITEDEDRATGAVRFGVYADYVRAMIGNSWQAPFVFAALIGTTIGLTLLPMAQMSWLGGWTDTQSGQPHATGFWNAILD